MNLPQTVASTPNQWGQNRVTNKGWLEWRYRGKSREDLHGKDVYRMRRQRWKQTHGSERSH